MFYYNPSPSLFEEDVVDGGGAFDKWIWVGPNTGCET